jgi:hypothetical protein
LSLLCYFCSFVDIDILSIQQSEADYLVSEQFGFYGVRLSAPGPTPNLEDRISLFVWFLPLNLSGMFDSTSSYATAVIALRVTGALIPHHHNKVGTPSVGIDMTHIRFL